MALKTRVPQVDMESMRKDVLTFNASRALADAYVYKGMAMEYLKFVSHSEEVRRESQFVL